MFAHITTERQLQRTNATSNHASSRPIHTHLSIAVAIALSCTVLQVQAADNNQTYNELPVPEAAFEYKNIETPQSVNNNEMYSGVTTQSGQLISKRNCSLNVLKYRVVLPVWLVLIK
jgi:phospholipase A1